MLAAAKELVTLGEMVDADKSKAAPAAGAPTLIRPNSIAAE
jgi:hypothetical protein